jgi:hypothetical protein
VKKDVRESIELVAIRHDMTKGMNGTFVKQCVEAAPMSSPAVVRVMISAIFSGFSCPPF